MENVNAIEIRDLTKSFKGMYALNGLNMTVPVGSIYGFIGENGSGKSTTEKLICGLLVKDKGSIKLFGKDYTDAGVRVIENIEEEIDRVLKIVRMEDSKFLKFKSCSLGMKQRIGIALALLGDPKLLILDEPINGLDTDGMRIMREILVDITKTYGCTVLISSHILGELEKIATHYGIIKQGKMILEMSAKDMDNRSRVFTTIKTKDLNKAYEVLKEKFESVKLKENYIKVYDVEEVEVIVEHLFKNNIVVSEVKKNKIGLEEYYIEVMSNKEGK